MGEFVFVAVVVVVGGQNGRVGTELRGQLFQGVEQTKYVRGNEMVTMKFEDSKVP